MKILIFTNKTRAIARAAEMIAERIEANPRVVSDQFELVSVCLQTHEPMRNKAAATQQEQRRGSA